VTEFSESVYRVTSKIPPGKVATYGSVARAIGKPKASHAVGQALKANPRPPNVVPCHRVVRSDGDVGGYSGRGGVAKKVRLLTAEGVRVESGRIDLGRFLFADLG
jgi:O-6-methylguanine DNA methyltransferase